MLDDDSPEGLVAALLEADLRNRPRQADRVLEAAARHGAALAGELRSNLAVARGLESTAREDLRACVTELAYAAGTRETYEVLLRDVAQLPLASIADELDHLEEEHGPPGDLDLALALLAEGVREDDEGLRAVGAHLVAYEEPGTPGVLEILLREFRHAPTRGGHDLCTPGDSEAAPELLEWLRERYEASEPATDDVGLACDIGVHLLDWGVPLQPSDRALAHAGIEQMCLRLEDSRAELQAQIQEYDDLIGALRSRLPGRLRPAGPRPAVRPNDPCPCGSGRKRKKCCG